MWWLALSMSSAAGALAIWGCGSNRKDVKPAPGSKKSGKLSRSLKKGKSSKSARSSKSRRSRKTSKSGRSGKKSLKSSKSGRKSSKSGKLSKDGKNSKSTKLAKSGKLAKSEKSGKKSTKRSKQTLVAKKPTVEKPVVSKSTESAESVSKSQEPTSQTPRPAQIVELRAEPQEMSFQNIGGLQTFKVINESNEHRAFKVKCSDNQLYRVAPVFGFIEPKSSAKIDVLRQNGSAKVDKLVLITAPAGDSTKLPKEILDAAPNGSSQMTVIPLLVEV